jgi:hypothetical protein
MIIHGTRALFETAKYSSTPAAVSCVMTSKEGDLTFQALVGDTLDLWTRILALTTNLQDETYMFNTYY